MSIPTIRLNDGHEIPQLGFGVFRVPDAETVDAVSAALEAGYRHIDTAAVYGNERGVGAAIRDSGIAREEVFVTTKVWNGDQGYEKTLRAVAGSLERLGTDYVDLLLIHWQAPELDLYQETWRAFEELAGRGSVKSIGVSNFTEPHLDRLVAGATVTPAINQIELHPRHAQAHMRAVNDRHGIRTEAYSPLANGSDVLAEPVVTKIAQEHGKSSAQVILRWHVQLGNVVIPKSVTPSRIAENREIFDFALSPEEVQEICALDQGRRVGLNPDKFSMTGVPGGK